MADPVRSAPLAAATTREPLWWGALLLVVTAAAAVWFVLQVVDHGEQAEHEHGLVVVRTAAALLDGEAIAGLAGTPADAGTPRHASVRRQLAALLEANPEFRFAYLMRPLPGDPGRFVFLADAEPPESPDYSAPGDVYDGPSDDLRRAVDTRRANVSAASTDAWGTWVSAAAPIFGSGGEVVAVLGVDMAQAEWIAAQGRYRGFGLAVAGLVLSLVALFLLGLHLQRRAALKLAALGGELAARVDELEQAQDDLRLADVVVRHTSEAIAVLDPQMRILQVNPAFERLTGRRAAEVIGRPPPVLMDDPALRQRVAAALAAGDHWDDEIVATRPDGSHYSVGALAEVVRDADGRIEHFVVLLHDLSAQKQVEERLRELSATDGLTGIANRRAFDEALVREWERALRAGEPLSVVMADIDFFKRYNDRYGHLAGDACLRQVAAALKAGVRQGGDLAARYGGEEFVVVLPGADAAAARQVAESLRRRVEALALPHADNPGGAVVTISLGVATAQPTREQAPTGLVDRADQALYRAKAAGRNRVEADG